MDRDEEERSSSNRKSRESRDHGSNATASAMATGDVIQVNMSKLADVLGCSLEELLQSLKREATHETEGASEGQQDLDLEESVPYPPANVRQALMTTVSRKAASALLSGEEYLPRPPWVLGNEGGKTLIELVLLNLIRGGVERVVIVVGKDGARIREAVSRSRADEKITIEFLEDNSEAHRQFHAKSILRGRNAFDSPFLFITSDHLFHPGLLHQLVAQDLGEDGGCVLVEDGTGPEFVQGMAATAVFVRRAQSNQGDTEDAEKQASPRVMAIGRRDQGQRQQWDGVECGAMVLSTEIFDTLADIGKRRRYFTLADGLDRMAGQGLLRSVSTEGKPWLALETELYASGHREGKARLTDQLRHGHEALVQGLVNEADLFPSEASMGASPSGVSGAAAATSTSEDHEAIPLHRRVSLAVDGRQNDAENQEDDAPQDFKGFILPVGARSEAGVGPSSVPDEASFLTRGNSLRRRVGLDDATVQGDEQTRSRQHSRRNLFLGQHDAEAGERGSSMGSAAVNIPWSGRKPGEVGFIVSVPGEDGGEELVFAVPNMPEKPTPTPGPCCGPSGGILGPCCGGGPAMDSDEEAGLLADDDDDYDPMDDYNCLGGGIFNACLPELPTEMPSDIQSVRVTTEVVADKESDEHTLAVHVIVDRRVPVLGWVLMVSALLGLAAMAPMGDLVSKMSPETAPPMFPVWRYTCSSIMYSPWFLLMVAGSKSARAELRDWSAIAPIVLAGIGLAGWGLCFYTALNFTDPNMVALLASLTPMCLVVWRGVTGESVHTLEIVGVLLALAGGIVSTVGQGGDDDSEGIAPGVEGVEEVQEPASNGGQTIGYALGLGAACCGGLYVLNAKAARSKVEVSHFAFIASLVPALFCTTVLVAGYGASAKGREMLFGPSGLLGWTQSPGLALAQIVSSILGDVIGNFGFYLLLKYISPLIVSLVSLTVPLLAVVEGLMLGVVSPPGFLFGVGACLILIGAATASMVTMLPHTEVFDATEAVKMANDGDETAGVDKSASPLGYGSINESHKRRSSLEGIMGGQAHIRSLSMNDPKYPRSSGNYGNGAGAVGGSINGGPEAANDENQSLLQQGGGEEGGSGSRSSVTGFSRVMRLFQ